MDCRTVAGALPHVRLPDSDGVHSNYFTNSSQLSICCFSKLFFLLIFIINVQRKYCNQDISSNSELFFPTP